MNLLHAVVLGALQGFAEVLPISSSAHLILVPWLLKWPESGLTFDVALHVGTLLALALYFWRDIIELVVSFFDAIVARSLNTPARRLPFLIIAATVPGSSRAEQLHLLVAPPVANGVGDRAGNRPIADGERVRADGRGIAQRQGAAAVDQDWPDKAV